MVTFPNSPRLLKGGIVLIFGHVGGVADHCAATQLEQPFPQFASAEVKG